MNYRSMTNDELLTEAMFLESASSSTLVRVLAERLEQEQEKVKYLEELTGEQAW